MAGGAGCGQGTAKVAQKSARVTVNSDTLTTHDVSCAQVQWLLTMDIRANPANVRAVLQLDLDQPKSQSINIENFNGFSGVADAAVGKAEATFSGGAYHITGTVHRTNPENPAEPENAAFSIDATC
ncbi:MAG TPA: lipoprotein LpqH [Mycobacterium sp.]|nr:lipoprotein LpqH [Mycobacterium sp.]